MAKYIALFPEKQDQWIQERISTEFEAEKTRRERQIQDKLDAAHSTRAPDNPLLLLAEFLQGFLTKRTLSQGRFASGNDFSQASVSKWLSGKVPSEETLPALIHALEMHEPDTDELEFIERLRNAYSPAQSQPGDSSPGKFGAVIAAVAAAVTLPLGAVHSTPVPEPSHSIVQTPPEGSRHANSPVPKTDGRPSSISTLYEDAQMHAIPVSIQPTTHGHRDITTPSSTLTKATSNSLLSQLTKSKNR